MLRAGLAGVRYAARAGAALSAAACAVHAQVVIAPSMPQIGSSNPVTAEPAVTRPRTTPCVVTLFQNLEFADYTPKTYSYTPPASCPGPWSKVVFTADFTVTAGRQYDRSAAFYLGHSNIYYGTTAEPRAALSQAWLLVLPAGWPVQPPWYDTSSGMFEAPPGNAVALTIRRGPGGAASGALMTNHASYVTFAEIARQIQVPAGAFLVRLEINPRDRVFSLDGLGPDPLSELPRVLREQYGLADEEIPVLGMVDGQPAEMIRRVGQDIVLVPEYTAEVSFGDWLQLTEAYGAIARAEGVTVWFPALRSRVQFRPGDGAPAVFADENEPPGALPPICPRRELFLPLGRSVWLWICRFERKRTSRRKTQTTG